MSGGRTWQGDWETRLYERTRERGFQTVTEFAAARPAVPTLQLAEELGGTAEDLNAVQVYRGMLDEAEKAGTVKRLMRDMLARSLAEWLPDGWPEILEDRSRFLAAAALGNWVASTPDALQKAASGMAKALMASAPPAGWRPMGPDDERLMALIPDEPAKTG